MKKKRYVIIVVQYKSLLVTYDMGYNLVAKFWRNCNLFVTNSSKSLLYYEYGYHNPPRTQT